METKITMLPVAMLHPHRDNPRKELGDLTELAESIKANGVMQNLTVIPIEEAEPEAEKGVKYYYAVNRYDIKVYKKEPKPKEKTDAAEKEKKLRKKAQVQALNDLAERCFESRKSFVLGFDAMSVTHQTIFDFISAILLSAEYSGVNRSVQREFIGSTEFRAYTCLQDGEREKFFRTATPRKRAIVAA